MVEWKLRSVVLGFLGYFFLAFEQGSNVDWFLFGRLLILSCEMGLFELILSFIISTVRIWLLLLVSRCLENVLPISFLT